MGTYLNPGCKNFIEFISDEYYVDKTMMLSELNKLIDTKDKYVCILRPRRFGKTYASEMNLF